MFTGIMAAIATGFVPLYSSIREQQGQMAGNRFTSGVINMTFLFGAGLSLLGSLFAGPIVSVMAYGFSGQVYHLTVYE